MKKLFLPVRLKSLYSRFSNHTFRLLDVGCGNHSPSITKKYFPQCEYHGIDRDRYNVNDKDMAMIDRFYRIDLDAEPLVEIPDAYFDAVMVSHVLEHLQNPISLVEQLCRKIRPGGVLYLEFPSLKSLALPSREGTLQFCDDSTHVHLPNPYEIANALFKSKLKIVKGGTRRDPIRFVAAPLFFLQNGIRRILGKKPRSKGLWDFYGFAYYIYAVKQ